MKRGIRISSWARRGAELRRWWKRVEQEGNRQGAELVEGTDGVEWTTELEGDRIGERVEAVRRAWGTCRRWRRREKPDDGVRLHVRGTDGALT